MSDATREPTHCNASRFEQRSGYKIIGALSKLRRANAANDQRDSPMPAPDRSLTFWCRGRRLSARARFQNARRRADRGPVCPDKRRRGEAAKIIPARDGPIPCKARSARRNKKRPESGAGSDESRRTNVLKRLQLANADSIFDCARFGFPLRKTDRASQRTGSSRVARLLRPSGCSLTTPCTTRR